MLELLEDILILFFGVCLIIFGPFILLILNNNIGRGGGGSYAEYMDKKDKQRSSDETNDT